MSKEANLFFKRDLHMSAETHFFETHIYGIHVYRKRPTYIWKEIEMALKLDTIHAKRGLYIDIHVYETYMLI